MSVPLSDTRLTEIEVRAAHLADYVVMPDEAEILAGIDVPALVAEVRRLRAVVADHEGEVVRYDADHERLSSELGRLRAQRAAVVELHDWDELVFGGFYCMHCTMDDSLSEPVSWPCPSLRAVGMTDEEALAIITAHRVAIAEGAGQ